MGILTKHLEVLILIVLDDALRALRYGNTDKSIGVLILIVLDDALRGSKMQSVGITTRGLNPYCTG